MEIADWEEFVSFSQNITTMHHPMKFIGGQNQHCFMQHMKVMVINLDDLKKIQKLWRAGLSKAIALDLGFLLCDGHRAFEILWQGNNGKEDTSVSAPFAYYTNVDQNGS